MKFNGKFRCSSEKFCFGYHLRHSKNFLEHFQMNKVNKKRNRKRKYFLQCACNLVIEPIYLTSNVVPIDRFTTNNNMQKKKIKNIFYFSRLNCIGQIIALFNICINKFRSGKKKSSVLLLAAETL